jgi:hypothetical protein
MVFGRLLGESFKGPCNCAGITLAQGPWHKALESKLGPQNSLDSRRMECPDSSKCSYVLLPPFLKSTRATDMRAKN